MKTEADIQSVCYMIKKRQA